MTQIEVLDLRAKVHQKQKATRWSYWNRKVKVDVPTTIKITHLPDSIGNLHKLKVLNISQQDITQLPNTITQLENLELLEARNVPLVALPENIGNFKS